MMRIVFGEILEIFFNDFGVIALFYILDIVNSISRKV